MSPLDKPRCFWGKQLLICLNKKKKKKKEKSSGVEIERTSEIFFSTRREISYLQAAMKYSIYYINTNEILSHLTKGIERRDFYV